VIASGAVLAAGGATAILAEPAAAAPGGCIGNAICLYSDTNFRPCVSWQPKTNDQDYSNDEFESCPGNGLNNNVDSLWNNTDHWVKFDDDEGVAADYFLCVAPGNAHHHLETIQMSGSFPNVNGWGDDISGHVVSQGRPAGCDDYIEGRLGCSY
jgi:hypothetical protein